MGVNLEEEVQPELKREVITTVTDDGREKIILTINKEGKKRSAGLDYVNCVVAMNVFVPEFGTPRVTYLNRSTLGGNWQRLEHPNEEFKDFCAVAMRKVGYEIKQKLLDRQLTSGDPMRVLEAKLINSYLN